MEFDFIGDRGFQLILKRDFREVQACIEAGAYKASMILSGSILETLLSDYFCDNLPAGKQKSDILKLSLNSLLELSVEQNLISSTDNNLASVLKTFRNLIHPGREVRSLESVDGKTAKLSYSILELLIIKIEKKYKEQYAHTAEEILNKLDDDWNFISVYGLAITKLSGLEKNKLFDELLEIEIEQKEKYEHFIDPDKPSSEPVYPNIESVKDLTTELIPLLQQDFLVEKLEELRDSVTNGECIESVAAYNILHEQLSYLKTEDQEFIAIYMLSTFGSIFENSRDLLHDRTYSTIGKYIHSEKGIKAVKELVGFCIANFVGKGLGIEFDVLEQILNSLSAENKESILTYMADSIVPYKDDLPTSVAEFAAEASKRGLISLE